MKIFNTQLVWRMWKDSIVYIPLLLHAYWARAQCRGVTRCAVRGGRVRKFPPVIEISILVHPKQITVISKSEKQKKKKKKQKKKKVLCSFSFSPSSILIFPPALFPFFPCFFFPFPPLFPTLLSFLFSPFLIPKFVSQKTFQGCTVCAGKSLNHPLGIT